MSQSDATLPEPTAEALAHSQALRRRIRDEIAAGGGWIGFDRYMDLALYTPELGYYAAGASKLGAGGDFVTAPELSPLFSATLARQIAEVVPRLGDDVLELGAGSGRMAADVLLALEPLDALPARYLILEVSDDLRARQQQRLQALPHRLAKRVRWLDRLPTQFCGVMLGNELLDALPVHLMVWREEGILERGVVVRDTGFCFEDRPATQAGLLSVAGALDPPAPYLSEISLAARALVRSLAATLQSGVLMFVDYGFGEREYYHPQRNLGTLMCHYRHRAHGDPFFLPGLQDITAHVDFSAVARAGEQGGLMLLGYTTQAHFLINLGITELLARTPAERAAEYLPLAAQAQRLLSPSEMGELFKVIALGRGVLSPLSGFASGDMSRLL